VAKTVPVYEDKRKKGVSFVETNRNEFIHKYQVSYNNDSKLPNTYLQIVGPTQYHT